MAGFIHDSYVKGLLEDIVGDRFVSKGDLTKVTYGGSVDARIDGVVGDCCAIEIESRVPKQIRGAILDLLTHTYRKKLLILVPAHLNKPDSTKKHAEYILRERKKTGEKTAVVLLGGTGAPHRRRSKMDKRLIRNALKDLGCL